MQNTSHRHDNSTIYEHNTDNNYVNDKVFTSNAGDLETGHQMRKWLKDDTIHADLQYIRMALCCQNNATDSRHRTVYLRIFSTYPLFPPRSHFGFPQHCFAAMKQKLSDVNECTVNVSLSCSVNDKKQEVSSISAVKLLICHCPYAVILCCGKSEDCRQVSPEVLRSFTAIVYIGDSLH